jgi:hypothetical protein
VPKDADVTEGEELDTLQDADLSRTVLRQIAAAATTARWGYCPKCRTKVQTDVPDTAARVAAAKALGSDTDSTLDQLATQDPATYTPMERALLHEWAIQMGAPQ